MKYTLMYDRERNVVFYHAEGPVGFGDLIRITEEIHALRPPAGLRVLADLTDAEVSLTYDEAYELRRRTAEVSSPKRPVRQAICTDSDMNYGMARMYEMSREIPWIETRIHRTLKDCLGALELDELPAEFGGSEADS